MIPAVCDKYDKLDCLWECNQLSPNLCPLWSEFIQRLFEEYDTVRKSKFVLLPFTDLLQTDLNCVYSALKFISETVTRNVKLLVCAFNQALCCKALLITVSLNSILGAIVMRLVSFHAIMSFVDCTGYLIGPQHYPP